MDQKTSVTSKITAVLSERFPLPQRRRSRACFVVGVVASLLLASIALSQAKPASAASNTGCIPEDHRCTFEISANTDDAGNAAPLPGGSDCRGDSIDNPEIYFGECPNGKEIISGFRFDNVDLHSMHGEPTKIYLEFTVDYPYDSSDAINIDIYGQSSDNPTTFSKSSMPRNRLLTKTPVTWQVSDRWTTTEIRQTPDLRSLFADIKAAGWKNGNAMAFIFRRASDNPAGQHRRVFAYEREHKSAKLVFEFGQPYYWGADTIDEKYWGYCMDGSYDKNGCSPGQDKPLDFYIGKLGSGACTLWQYWSSIHPDGTPLYCGSWTGPEIARYMPTRGGTDLRLEPDPPLPVMKDTRYSYWYLRGPDSQCPIHERDSHRAVEALGRGTPPGDFCIPTLEHYDVHEGDLYFEETMYGCLQAYAFLETYQIPQYLEGTNNIDYTSDYMQTYAGNTLFVDLEQPKDPRCGWNEIPDTMVNETPVLPPAPNPLLQNRSVLLGYLYGMREGIKSRQLDSNIGIYTNRSSWWGIMREDGNGDDFLSPLFRGNIVLWAAGTMWGSNAYYPPLYASSQDLLFVTGLAPDVFNGRPQYGFSIANSLPVVWQFHLDNDLDVAIQSPSGGFTPRPLSNNIVPKRVFHK